MKQYRKQKSSEINIKASRKRKCSKTAFSAAAGRYYFIATSRRVISGIPTLFTRRAVVIITKTYLIWEEKIIGQPVIFDLKYVPYKLKSNATAEEIAEHKRNREFYDMSSGGNSFYKYITTEGKLIGEEARKFTMLEYLQKNTGVFNQDGMISKEEIKAMKKRAQTGAKNLWYGFISFDKEHNCASPQISMKRFEKTFH